VTESLLIVSDSGKGLIAFYDRDGYYRNSVTWYPGKQIHIHPVQISSNGKLLTFVDPLAKQVGVVSLITQEPFYSFMELLELLPGTDHQHITAPCAATISTDGSFWVGDIGSHKIAILTPAGDFANYADEPQKTPISQPCDFALQVYQNEHASIVEASDNGGDRSLIRTHVLDRSAGKVFVYDQEGHLKLVYPQDRRLANPTSIAIDSSQRVIFVTEVATRSVTAFGY